MKIRIMNNDTSIRKELVNYPISRICHRVQRYAIAEVRESLNVVNLHTHTRASSVREAIPYREVWGVDVDTAAGVERSCVREAGKRPLLLRLNLFNLPNPLHADFARWRERSPLSAALNDSNSCVTSGNQPPEHDRGFPEGRFECTLRLGRYFYTSELAHATAEVYSLIIRTKFVHTLIVNVKIYSKLAFFNYILYYNDIKLLYNTS